MSSTVGRRASRPSGSVVAGRDARLSTGTHHGTMRGFLGEAFLAILVVGGAGYIGSHAARALRGAGYEVVIYDNLSTGFRRLAEGFELVEGDIADEARLRPVLGDMDAVMHFAAHAYVGESVENPQKYFRNNVAGGLSLLNCVLEAGIHRFVFSSSCAVYARARRQPIPEATAREPLNPYGASKLFFEHALEAYGRAYGLRSVSLRYFNAAGADESGEIGEMHHPETHLIPLALAATTANGPELQVPVLQIYGSDYPTPDGTCGRCSTLKGTATKTAATRWSSILGQAVDIPCSKSFRRWKMPLDTGFGERSDRGGRAILQFWWPTPRKLKECWDGPPSAISLTSLRVRGPGWRKLRKLRDGSNRREVTYNGSWKQRAHRPSRSGLRRLRRRTEWSYRLCRLDSVGCQKQSTHHLSVWQ